MNEEKVGSEVKERLNDRLRRLILEIYEERKVERALPMTVLSVLSDLHWRGVKGNHEKRVARILQSIPLDSSTDIKWETPEEIKARRPDPETKTIHCSFCGRVIEVPLDFKYPLGTYYDTYCQRRDCIIDRKEVERRAEASRVDPPRESEEDKVKRLRRELGVEDVIANRGKRSLPPLPERVSPLCEVISGPITKVTKRKLANLLDVEGFAEGYLSPDQIRLYKDLASRNYSNEELEQRVKDRKYPTIHFELSTGNIPFWERMVMLENQIVLRGLETDRLKHRNLGEDVGARPEGEVKKRNAVRLGPGQVPGRNMPDIKTTEDYQYIERQEYNRVLREESERIRRHGCR